MEVTIFKCRNPKCNNTEPGLFTADWDVNGPVRPVVREYKCLLCGTALRLCRMRDLDLGDITYVSPRSVQESLPNAR
jgi:hypothetical protein